MQTQTTTTPETATAPSNERDKGIQNRVVDLVNHVGRSSEYRIARSKGATHTEAFSNAIETIITDPNDAFNDYDHALFDTIAKLGKFVEAEKELENINDSRPFNGNLPSYSYERTKTLKREYIIPFNHSLKMLINEAPNATMRELTQSLTQVYGVVYSKENALNPKKPKDPSEIAKPSDIAHRLEQTINGMRHEIAAETMLSAAGVAYDYDISVEEDARGIDIIAYIDGNREPIDIKASIAAEQRARSKRHDSRAIWTGLEHADFSGIKGTAMGALSIPYTTAQAKSNSFVRSIRNTVAATPNRY